MGGTPNGRVNQNEIYEDLFVRWKRGLRDLEDYEAKERIAQAVAGIQEDLGLVEAGRTHVGAVDVGAERPGLCEARRSPASSNA